MYKRSEGFFKGFNEAKLYYQKWEPTDEVQGVLIITHGQGEHSDSYSRVVDALAGKKWLIFAWDWRGHGRSEGTRGYAAHFTDYCHDFEAFLNLLMSDSKISKNPMVLLGHSMGGLIQEKTILSHPQWIFAGQVLSAPLFGLSVKVPAYKELAAQVLVSLLPKVTLGNEINNEDLTRDPEILREFDRDVLRHNRISSGVYLGSVESMEFVTQRAKKVTTPTLLQISDNDPIVSTPASLKFFDNLTCHRKSLKVYPQRKHEIYNDLGREQVLQDLVEYLSSLP